MGKVEKERVEKVGDFLFRYMRARHRFKNRLEAPLPAHELAMLIQRGKTGVRRDLPRAGRQPAYRAGWQSR